MYWIILKKYIFVQFLRTNKWYSYLYSAKDLDPNIICIWENFHFALFLFCVLYESCRMFYRSHYIEPSRFEPKSLLHVEHWTLKTSSSEQRTEPKDQNATFNNATRSFFAGKNVAFIQTNVDWQNSVFQIATHRDACHFLNISCVNFVKRIQVVLIKGSSLHNFWAADVTFSRKLIKNSESCLIWRIYDLPLNTIEFGAYHLSYHIFTLAKKYKYLNISAESFTNHWPTGQHVEVVNSASILTATWYSCGFIEVI